MHGLQVKDFIEEALVANSSVTDEALLGLATSFTAEAVKAEMEFSGLASQTSMSLDAFIAAAHSSQVHLL